MFFVVRVKRLQSVTENEGRDPTDTSSEYHPECTRPLPSVNLFRDSDAQGACVAKPNPDNWQQPCPSLLELPTNEKNFQDKFNDCQEVEKMQRTIANKDKVQSSGDSSQHMKADLQETETTAAEGSDEDVCIIKVCHTQKVASQQTPPTQDVRHPSTTTCVTNSSSLFTGSFGSSSLMHETKTQQAESHKKVQQESHTSGIQRKPTTPLVRAPDSNENKKCPTLSDHNSAIPTPPQTSDILPSKGLSTTIMPPGGNPSFYSPQNLIFLIPVSSQPTPGSVLRNVPPEPPMTLPSVLSKSSTSARKNLESKRPEVQSTPETPVYGTALGTHAIPPPTAPPMTAYTDSNVPRIETTASGKMLPRRPTPIQSSSYNVISRMTPGLNSPLISPQPPQHPKTWTFCSRSAFDPVTTTNQVVGNVEENKITAVSSPDRKWQNQSLESPIDLTSKVYLNTGIFSVYLHPHLQMHGTTWLGPRVMRDLSSHCRHQNFEFLICSCLFITSEGLSHFTTSFEKGREPRESKEARVRPHQAEGNYSQ